MSEEMEGTPQQGNIYKALCDVMADITAVTKDKKNVQQGYSYRGIDDVYNMIQPIFGKHRVFMFPKVLSTETEEKSSKSGGILYFSTVTMEYKFFTDDGSYLTTIAIGRGMDSGDKSLDKAKSSAMKYLLLQMFTIPTEEDKDTEVDSHETKQGKPPNTTTPPATQGKAKPPEIKVVDGKYKTSDDYIARINGGTLGEKDAPIDTLEALKGWQKKHQPGINKMPTDVRMSIMAVFQERLDVLKKAESIPQDDPDFAGLGDGEKEHNPPD